MLPVSLDCSYLIAPSVFSNVYLLVSLDCPYLIAPSVFSNVYYLQRILHNVKNKEHIFARCTKIEIITIPNVRLTSRTTGRQKSHSSNCNRYFPSYEGVFFPLSTTILLLDFTISITRRVSYNNQQLLTRREHLGHHSVLVWSVLLIFLVFCVVFLCLFCLSSICLLPHCPSRVL